MSRYCTCVGVRVEDWGGLQQRKSWDPRYHDQATRGSGDCSLCLLATLRTLAEVRSFKFGFEGEIRRKPESTFTQRQREAAQELRQVGGTTALQKCAAVPRRARDLRGSTVVGRDGQAVAGGGEGHVSGLACGPRDSSPVHRHGQVWISSAR